MTEAVETTEALAAVLPARIVEMVDVAFVTVVNIAVIAATNARNHVRRKHSVFFISILIIYIVSIFLFRIITIHSVISCIAS